MYFSIQEPFVEKQLENGRVLEQAIEISRAFPDKPITVWGNRYPSPALAKQRMIINNGQVVQDFADFERYVPNDGSWQYQMVEQQWQLMN